jgi:putative transposase
MLGLAHNQVIRIASDLRDGLYRVIFDAPIDRKVVLARISESDRPACERKGRNKLAHTKSPRKKAPLPLVGSLIWLDRDEIVQLDRAGQITTVEIERERISLSSADEKIFLRRKEVMAGFLNFENLSTALICDGGILGLVNAAATNTGASRPLIYKLWSLLCRFGFNADSLKPLRRKCGAPGTMRPCDPGGRKKPGRKTDKQRLTPKSDKGGVFAQPGMNSHWHALILLADKKIPTPKPRFSGRYRKIIESHFVQRYREKDGTLVPLELNQFSYPNKQQARRVLNTVVPKLQQLLEKTTKGHFERTHRAMRARNWKGVAGPGHTWAIDSTIGDIYLRSSVNRAWIIGRPIVYIIVDIWSTAIVGFYVCLTGPSWDTAKVSLFSAAASPELIGNLWNYEPMLSLYPYPTLPANLMCDRGEYLSRAASFTAAKLIPCMSYAPPYRPDLKGLVEVLHRIKKDRQYFWLPGAIDARRREFDLRRFNPNDAVLTVSEYVHYLHIIFNEYNLTAPREYRLDAHMRSVGVLPSPSGLWRWGHEVGIGTRRFFTQSDLVSDLLPSQSAIVTRNGVRFCGIHYEAESVSSEQWTAYARNFGSWTIDVNHFPGSVSRIWTPNASNPGLLELQISEQTTAARGQTFDEVLDAFMFANLSRADIEHARMTQAIKSSRKVQEIVTAAKSATEEAIQRSSGALPTMSESRRMEAQLNEEPITSPAEVQTPIQDDATTEYLEMMKRAFASANAEGVQ